ncbi:MAG TPA: phosphatase PAP2 family protein [Rhodanobacteraceae bacterium]
MPPFSDPSWRHQLRDRLAERWVLKLAGISAVTTAVMLVYFWLLDHPLRAVTVMPRTPLDALIPFTPWAVLPYASLWFYIGLAPALLHMRGEMRRYTVAAVGLGLVGFALFALFPTAVPPVGIDWARWPLVAFLKSADASGNACPSLHVAYATLTAIWLRGTLRVVGAPRWLRALNLVWATAIVWSTLATRQHVVLDVVAGAVLGAAVALVVRHVPLAGRAQRAAATC